MVKDRNGTQLEVGDWVKRISPDAAWIKVGDVTQISSISKDQLYISNKLGPYNPRDFVKVERHPHADAIIAAANDMNVTVRDFSGISVFKHNCFFENDEYPVVDHTLEELKETPKQKEIERIETEMRKLSDDLAKLREN